ncbi:hypothetical protein M378DRAFT_56420, partial [Amanita muscaria Koide BX008]
FEMDKKEWKIAAELRDALKIFKDGTLFFSRNGVPSLTTVIPAMDHIDSVITSNLESDKYSPAIRAALSIGQRTLNRYYSKTDYSETYRVAMILHPRHKLVYFRNAGWPEDWITTAENILRTNYDQKYKDI